MLEAYRTHVAERDELGVPPKPLDAAWTSELVELLQDPPKGEEDFLLDLLTNRIPPGVDEAGVREAAAFVPRADRGVRRQRLQGRQRERKRRAARKDAYYGKAHQKSASSHNFAWGRG